MQPVTFSIDDMSMVMIISMTSDYIPFCIAADEISRLLLLLLLQLLPLCYIITTIIALSIIIVFLGVGLALEVRWSSKLRTPARSQWPPPYEGLRLSWVS